jgi:serine protease Do
MGVVSGLARQLTPDSPMIYIQTDASINPGNSGGPLVNMAGEVVGINTMILSQSGGNEGLGFAAPSNIVSHVYKQIKEKGRVPRGQIGVSAQTITPALGKALGITQTTGVIIADVFPRGPAEAAGLQVGDVVVSMDDKPMENGRQFDVNLYQKAPGTSVTLRVVRNMANKTIRVDVEERRDDPLRFAGLVSMEENLVPKLGILVIDLDEQLRRRMPPLRKERGVIVAARSTGALPWQQALQPGDIIYSVNRQEVQSLAGLRSSIAQLSSGAPVVLQIEREGMLRYLTLEVN